MSNADNKPIIKKAQEILTTFGHEVKTSHLYEMFAQLSGHQDWNAAAAKGVDFKNVLTTKSSPLSIKGNLKSLSDLPADFLKDLAEGKYSDRLIYGYLQGVPFLADPLLSPNGIYTGSMGSGKSVALAFTVLTWLLANSEKTLVFIADPLKGANDYSAMFHKSQVVKVLSSESQILKLIDFAYNEAILRLEEFKKVKAYNFLDYEKKTKTSLTRILMVMEEFHRIPYQILNFYPDFKVEGSDAYKFYFLMRNGRSLGITILAATHKSTKSDIPPELLPFFTNKQVFRTSRGEANYLMGNSNAADISISEKGHAETDYGRVNFPYLSRETQKVLVDNFVKPLKSKNLLMPFDKTVDFLEGKSPLYLSRSLEQLIHNIDRYDANVVIKILLEKQGYKVELLDSKTNKYGISHFAIGDNGIKIAVMTRCQKGFDNISGKHIGRLKKSMENEDCTHGVIYTSAREVPDEVYTVANELAIEIVDYEDMLSIAHRIS